MNVNATPGGGVSVVRGVVFICPVCGAELSVVRCGAGAGAPRCCNTDMVLTARVNSIYACSVCGSEIMLVRGEKKGFEPACCNTQMQMTVPGTL